MSNILERIEVRVRCGQCGETYGVPASFIDESHRLLEAGCPGSAHECPPSFFATLLDASALRQLAQAWAEIERSARGPTDQVSLRSAPTVTRSVQPAPEGLELMRWESEGGAPAPPSAHRASARRLH